MYKIRDSLQETIQKKERSDGIFLLTLALIILAMAVIVFLYSAVFFNVVVDGGSMKSTLQSGDVLVANRNASVEKGSIIVIDGVKQVSGKDDEYVWLIKRAIAFEGDNVRIADGKVFVNGEAIVEDYLDEGMITTDFNGKYSSTQGVTLGKDEIFFLGDNRKESADSRSYGTCTQENVVGVIEEWSLSARWLTGTFHKIGMFLRGQRV